MWKRSEVETCEIRSREHPLYPEFEKLYAAAFPVFEQRTEQQQDKAWACPEYHLAAFRENGLFVGFIACWEFPAYLYVEHFAVAGTLRGKGYGSRILNGFAGKTVVLEIDPVTDPVSEARLRFYERCGFCRNGYAHTHPPYRDGHKGHALVVLTSGRKIGEEEYRQFRRDLERVVME